LNRQEENHTAAARGTDHALSPEPMAEPTGILPEEISAEAGSADHLG